MKLKFQAWIEQENEMIETSNTQVFDTVAYAYSTKHDYTFQIKPEQLRVWTGLKDKNGKEIYEGDVVHYQNEDWVVAWKGSLCGFQMVLAKEYGKKEWLAQEIGNNNLNQTEIIGNIYENPDLLKQT